MSERFSSQSFLGAEAGHVFESAIVGIVGLGGGGSHIAQQLAHVGFLHFILFDPDEMEPRNLNRQIGAVEKDVDLKTPKIDIVARLIKSIRSRAVIEQYKSTWQKNPDPLKKCDVIFGCVDGFQERRTLEVFARRYVIPCIDIGMDIYPAKEGQPPRMVGQVILSLPGKSCMRCLGFPSEAALTSEAENYGAAGHVPQVVWGNGVLASVATGIAVDLFSNWTKKDNEAVYLSYDGNDLTVTVHPRLAMRNRVCDHFPPDEVGDPKFKPL